jgi:hypothetical protein
MGVWIAAGVSGGHINPAVCDFFCPIDIDRGEADAFFKGHSCACDFPRLPMEKSSSAYTRCFHSQKSDSPAGFF